MPWSVNECISLLCEGMCVVLVVVGVYVKDRWSLSGVVPPLLLFFLFFIPASLPCHLSKNLTSSISWPPADPHPPFSLTILSVEYQTQILWLHPCSVSQKSLFKLFCWWGFLCVWLPFWSLLTWHVGLWSYLRFVKQSWRWTRWQPWALDVSDCALWTRFSSHTLFWR